MSSTNHAQAERSSLCELFDALGPDAPTLCEGWTTRDLAAHLVVREGRPDAALGLLAAPLARYGEKVRRASAAKPWDELVSRVRNGPPMTSLMRIGAIDRAANTLEYFVHHEDVRRATDGWEARQLDPGLTRELTKIITRMAKLLSRRAPCGVTVAVDGAEPFVAKAADPMVTVRGPVGEIVMFLEGRQRASRAGLDGPAEAVEALRASSFGI